MTDPIKAKIQELVSQAIQRGSGKQILSSPITLPVVLRAMLAHTNNEGQHTINDQDYTKVMWHWKWAKDNYAQQSEECKQFIGSLLGV